jgi:8-amino-3,8-dideoxy-alpha-D-manno-octulosonate transaminase
MSEKLAIDGGTPVRTKPMPPSNPGECIIGDEERAQVLEVLDARSPFRFYGPNLLKKTEQFEKEFSDLMGVKHALGVTSGTAALKVALIAAGVGPGDEVIVPAVTFIACAGAVVMCRARPVFANVGTDIGLDPADVERKITKRTAAIMAVHILGGAADMDPILEIGKRRGIKVIEDSAQSAGAIYKGRRVGSMGEVNAYSMQFQKVITAGEGGVVTTNDEELFDRAVRAHDHGISRWNNVPEKNFCGEVYRMSEMHGAFALAQVRKLDNNLATMRRHNKRIRQAIAELPGITVRTLADIEGATGQTLTFYLKTAELAERWRNALDKEGIPTFVLYGGTMVFENPQIMNQKMPTKHACPFDCPLYDEPITYSTTEFVQSRDILDRSVWTYVSPLLTDDDCGDIIAAIRKVHAALGA